MLFKILCIHLRFCVRGATPLTKDRDDLSSHIAGVEIYAIPP